MKSNSSFYSLIIGASLIAGSHQASASALSELSASDQAKVQNGELVAVYTPSDVAGAPWPNCRIYKWVPATPEEAMAIFSDYQLQASYVPGLTKSQISSHQGKTSNVDYTVTLPMGFGSESYTAIDTISSYDSASSYKVSWTVVPTKTIKESLGDARFEAMDSAQGHGTLLAYYSFVYPVRWGVNLGWVVEKSKKTITENVAAIAKQIEKEVSERQSGSKQVDDQIKVLRDVLAQ
jgi:hypothetical protein